MVSKDTEPKRRYSRLLLTACVAGLAFVPMDFGTALLWSLGFVVVLWSVIQFLGSGISLLAREKLHWPTAVVAPLLTICCFGLAILASMFSFGVAEQFSDKVAEEIQHQCQSSECPSTLSTWKKGALRCASQTRTGYFTRYDVCYERARDGRSFNLWLDRNIDSGIQWSGGKGVDLQRHEIAE
jgi:hypothetical protein